MVLRAADSYTATPLGCIVILVLQIIAKIAKTCSTALAGLLALLWGAPAAHRLPSS